MMKKAIKFIIIGIIALIIIAIVTITALYINMMNPVSKNDEKVSVTIPKGATATSIGKILKDNDLIKSAEVFKLYTKLNNVNSMQAGEYDLNKNMSVSEIVEALEKGPDTSKKTIDITFLEGKNMRWIAKTIASKTNNTEQDVFNKLKDEKYLDSIIEKYWFITKDIKNGEAASLYYFYGHDTASIESYTKWLQQACTGARFHPGRVEQIPWIPPCLGQARGRGRDTHRSYGIHQTTEGQRCKVLGEGRQEGGQSRQEKLTNSLCPAGLMLTFSSAKPISIITQISRNHEYFHLAVLVKFVKFALKNNRQYYYFYGSNRYSQHTGTI